MKMFHHLRTKTLDELDKLLNEFLADPLVVEVQKIDYMQTVVQGALGQPEMNWIALIIYTAQTHMEGVEIQQGGEG